MPFIRVDSLSDLVLLEKHAHHEVLKGLQLPRQHLSASADDLKAQGNKHFSRGQFLQAAISFSQAIEVHVEELNAVFATCLLNRIACFLKLEHFGRARDDAAYLLETPLVLSLLSAAQVEKLHYRFCSALYRIGSYDKSLSASERALSLFPDSVGLKDLRIQAEQRIKEQQNGQYDWSAIYSSLAKTPVDIADFCTPAIQVQQIQGKGRGLVATSDIQPGQLLMVANPVATATGRDPINVQALNLSLENVDSPEQTRLPSSVMQKMLDQSELAAKIYQLYAGPAFPNVFDTKTDHFIRPLHGFDAGRVEGICSFNQFKIASVYSRRNAAATVGLYHLPSFMNHSCLGNASYTFFGNVFVLRATCKIKAGEEITSSYVNPTGSFEDRAFKLKLHTTDCDCQLCGMDREESTVQRRKRRQLLKELNRVEESASDANKLVLECERIAKALNETYTASRSALRPEMYTAYRSWSRALEAVGNRQKVVEVEKRALGCLGVVIGDDELAAAALRPDVILNQGETALLPRKPRIVLKGRLRRSVLRTQDCRHVRRTVSDGVVHVRCSRVRSQIC